MTGIILAGGKNSRIGIKKAFININGSTIIDNTLAVFKEIFLENIIVTNTVEDFSYTGVKVVRDIIPGKGSLGGLYTGLSLAGCDRCFVVACDMPYINPPLIRYITNIIGYDIVVPRIEGQYEPLFGSYSKKCADLIKKQIAANNLKITDLFSQTSVREVCADEIKKFDYCMRSFININTPEDLSKVILTNATG